jgi:hypothetical protein
MSPVDNLWTTRRSRAQLIHILVSNLTRLVRWIRFERAAVADSSLKRILLLPQLCLLVGLISVQMQPVQAATQADYLKLYAHSRLIDDKQYQCFKWIITKESRWNPKARNGSHYGLGQMRSTWYKNLDPYRQIDQTIKYITNRYESSCKARLFHEKNGWY